jgi:hypothetical protein
VKKTEEVMGDGREELAYGKVMGFTSSALAISLVREKERTGIELLRKLIERLWVLSEEVDIEDGCRSKVKEQFHLPKGLKRLKEEIREAYLQDEVGCTWLD